MLTLSTSALVKLDAIYIIIFSLSPPSKCSLHTDFLCTTAKSSAVVSL